MGDTLTARVAAALARCRLGTVQLRKKMKNTCTNDCQKHSTATTMKQIHQSAVSDCTSLHSDAAADNARFACKTNHIRLPTLASVCVDITQLFQHVRLAVEVFCRHTGARKLVPVICSAAAEKCQQNNEQQ